MKVACRLVLAVVVGLSWTAAPRVAWGAEPSPGEIAVARRLFREATRLENEKKWDEAEAKLREALAIKETPGVRYHVAYCQEQQGKLVEALVDYDRADELIQHGAKAADVAALVGPARDSLRKRVPRIKLLFPEELTGATLKVDGERIAPAVMHQPIPVNPGNHTVRVSAPDRQAFEQKVPMGEAETREVTVVLPRLAATSMDGSRGRGPAGAGDGPGGDTGSVSTSSSGWSTRTWVLIGEGAFTASALGTGVFYAIDKGNAQGEVDKAHAYIEANKPANVETRSACVSPATEDLDGACKDLASLTDQRDRAKTLSTVGFIGAGVGAAATVATFVLWRPEEKSVARSLRVAPTPVAGGGAFLSVSGAF